MPASPPVPGTRPATPTPATTGTPTPVPPAPVAKCGKPVTGKKGTSPCIKPAGHDAKCSTREYNPVDTSAITLDTLSHDVFATDERVTVVTDPGTRSDVQKRVDADVLAAWQAWQAKGKPDTLRAALAAGVAQRYWIEPAHEQAYRKLLRSAGTLHGCQVRIYPVSRHASGRHMLPWVARDQRKTKASKTTPASPATTAS